MLFVNVSCNIFFIYLLIYRAEKGVANYKVMFTFFHN